MNLRKAVRQPQQERKERKEWRFIFLSSSFLAALLVRLRLCRAVFFLVKPLHLG
jgi:hypothetical protein